MGERVVSVNLDIWRDGDSEPLTIAEGITRNLGVEVRRTHAATAHGELIRFTGPVKALKVIATEYLGDEFNVGQVQNL